MFIELTERVSHKLWRQIVKRERRRRIRQKAAQEMHLKYQQEQAVFMQDPLYLEELERLQCMEEEARRLEEEEATRRKEEWMLRDAALHSKFLNEKRKRQLQEEQQKKQEELIKKEWQEKQKMEEDKKKKEQVWVEGLRKDALLKAATDSLGKQGEQLTHNPEPPAGYNRRDLSPPKRESCPFFIKTGACRFGVQCSREHVYPERSSTILLPNMYTHFGMEHLAMEEKDSDIALEFSESEIYQHFREFFEDVLPEFQRCGKVVQFKVCSNASPHLRGNVYVQFMTEGDAVKACTLFNGRWYAGRQVTCYLVTIEKWKSALCGLYWRKQCPKGGHCNFLHAYRNPGNVFWQADKDMQPLGSPRKNSTYHRSPPERSSRARHGRSSETSSERRKSFQNHEDDEREKAESDMIYASRTEVNELSKRRNVSQGSRQLSGRSESNERLNRPERSSSKADKPGKSGRSGSRSDESRSKSRRLRSKSRSENKSKRSGSKSRRSRSKSGDSSSRSERSGSKSHSKRSRSHK